MQVETSQTLMELGVIVFMVGILEMRTLFLVTMELVGCVWLMQAQTQMDHSFISLLSPAHGLILLTHALAKYYREW